MKKFSAFLSLLLAAALSLSLTAAAAPVSAPVSWNGTSLKTAALVEDGSVFLPVRSLCEAMGYTVTWQNENGVKSILVQKDDDHVLLDLTNQQIEDNELSPQSDAAGLLRGRHRLFRLGPPGAGKRRLALPPAHGGH